MKRLAALLILLGLPLISSSVRAHDGPDGQISHKHNEVRSQPAANTEWHEAQVGETLYKQGRVTTADESMAAVVFRDDSSVAMRQNTLLIVYGHHALRDKHVIAMDAELERGTLRARLGELEGGRQATIASPSAATAIAGGNNLIKVDEQGTTRVANHGEGKTEVASKRGGKTKLAKGMGVKVEQAKRAAKPIVLPPTPGWSSGPQVFLAVPGQLGELRGGWTAIAEARGYYVELARDEVGVDVLAAIEVPATAEGFEVHGLQAGRYFVRVASVDGDQFESIPSEARALELIDVALAGPGGVGVLWPVDAASSIPRVLPGTALELPAGVRCGAKADALVDRPIYLDAGTTTLVCQTDEGREVAAFPVEVTALSAGFTDDQAFRVERGARVTREIAITSELPLPDELFVTPSAGLSVETIESLGGGRWRVTMLVDDDAPASGELALSLIEPAEGEVATFADVAVEVVEPSEPSEPPEARTRSERHMVELGLAGGVFVPAGNHGLYRPSTSEQAPMRPTGQVVGRIGYYPLRQVGIELAGRVMPTRIDDGQRVTAWSLRGQIVGQLATRVTPFVLVGGELIGVASPASALGRDSDFGFVVGGGLKAFVLPWLALRLGVNAGIHERVGSGFTGHFDADLGLSFVLGRRSAGRLKR
ncbi:FecR family protein [Nannocystaceae bacterium ST9]